MKNKNVGYLVIGISLVIVAIIIIFNTGMKDIVDETCSHGSECTMYDTIKTQTYLSLAISGLVFIIGLFLILSRPEQVEKIVIKKVKERPKKQTININNLDKDEKQIISLLQQENGGMFQATLMEKMDIGKVKTTRLLDKLEAKQLIERKRRGMNNIVVLKNRD